MKPSIRKLSVAVLLISSLMLGSCGSDKTEKPKDEPIVDEKKDNGIPFEKMTDEEMDVLKAGDVVSKLPDSEYLNTKDLDFLFVYDQWIKKGNEEYSKESKLYYTQQYQEDGEVVIEVDNVVESCEKYRFNEIFIGEMEYSGEVGTDNWYKYIYKKDGRAVPVKIISQERIDQLNKGEIHYIK